MLFFRNGMPSTRAGLISPSTEAGFKTAYFTAALLVVSGGTSHSPKAETESIAGAATAAPIAEDVCRRKLRQLKVLLAAFMLLLKAGTTSKMGRFMGSLTLQCITGPRICTGRCDHSCRAAGPIPDNATSSQTAARIVARRGYFKSSGFHAPLSLSASCMGRGAPFGGTVTSIQSSWPGLRGNGLCAVSEM